MQLHVLGMQVSVNALSLGLLPTIAGARDCTGGTTGIGTAICSANMLCVKNDTVVNQHRWPYFYAHWQEIARDQQHQQWYCLSSDCSVELRYQQEI
jgi:uncharacterized protein